MDQIKAYKLKAGLFFITGLISGVLLGAAGITALVSFRIDNYHEEITSLKSEIEDRDIRLSKLEKVVNSRKTVLNSIEVAVNFEGDQIDKIAIEKAIKDKYAKLIGREIKGIDMDMVADVIDNRIVRFRGLDYKLRVNKLALSDILKLWVTVEKIQAH